MPTEDCGICGAPVSLSAATHLLVNPSDADEVSDMYVCPRCYEDDLAPLLDAGAEGEPADPPETSEGA